MFSMLRLISYLPLILVGGGLLVYAIMLIQSKNFVSKELLWFILLLVIASSLPLFLVQVPHWLLPTQWSDFSFWQSLLETMKLRVEEWFYLNPTMKDVESFSIISLT